MMISVMEATESGDAFLRGEIFSSLQILHELINIKEKMDNELRFIVEKLKNSINRYMGEDTSYGILKTINVNKIKHISTEVLFFPPSLLYYIQEKNIPETLFKCSHFLLINLNTKITKFLTNENFISYRTKIVLEDDEIIRVYDLRHELENKIR